MSELKSHFGTAFLINLPDRTDRLSSAINELARLGWKLTSNEVRLFPASQFSERAGFPNAGVRGAFHSHWSCLRRACDEGHDRVLILEDDIVFSPALVRWAAEIFSKLDAVDWDLVYFGHEYTGSIPSADTDTALGEICFRSWFSEVQGLHFYGVSGRVLPRLLVHLQQVAQGVEGDQEFGPMPVDGAFNVFRRLNPDVRTLVACPKLGWQRPSRSDITPGPLDKVRFLRPLIRALRDLKHVVHSWRQ